MINLGRHAFGELGQPVEIDGEMTRIDRALMDVEAVQAGSASTVVRDVAADRRRRNDDRVAGSTRRHERIQVGKGTGPDTDLGEPGAEHAAGEVGRDHFDLLDRFEAHLVLLSGVAERRPRAEPGGQRRFCPRVHHVGRRVEVDALTSWISRFRAINDSMRIGSFGAGELSDRITD